MHKCEHTMNEWRIMPLILTVIPALYLYMGVHPVMMIFNGIDLLWLLLSAWMGHPFLPKKWLG
jgi:hypothetical protein